MACNIKNNYKHRQLTVSRKGKLYPVTETILVETFFSIIKTLNLKEYVHSVVSEYNSIPKDTVQTTKRTIQSKLDSKYKSVRPNTKSGT